MNEINLKNKLQSQSPKNYKMNFDLAHASIDQLFEKSPDRTEITSYVVKLKNLIAEERKRFFLDDEVFLTHCEFILAIQKSL